MHEASFGFVSTVGYTYAWRKVMAAYRRVDDLCLVSTITLPLFRSRISVAPFSNSVVTKNIRKKFRSVRGGNGKNLPLPFVR